MKTHILNTPIRDEDLEKIEIGDIVYLNGALITARDQAHHRLVKLGRKLPVDLNRKAILHAGPIMVPAEDVKSGWKVASIGPTTSMRMELFEKEFIEETGVKLIIGKGGMGEGTKAALQKYKQVYVQACPGCAVVLAAGIVGTKEPHWFEHGMPEAMWPLQAKHFGPFLVTMDSHGNSRYDKVRDYAQKVEKEILATK